MKSHLKVLIAVSATSILAGPFGIRLAMAQAEQNPSTQAVRSAQAPYAVQYDGRVTVRADRTATDTFTHRIKILTPGAIASVSQQQLRFVEGMEDLDTVEAFTEKPDGSKVPVGMANIITRDAASGLPGIYTTRSVAPSSILNDDDRPLVGGGVTALWSRENGRGVATSNLKPPPPTPAAILLAHEVVTPPPSVLAKAVDGGGFRPVVNGMSARLAPSRARRRPPAATPTREPSRADAPQQPVATVSHRMRCTHGWRGYCLNEPCLPG
jgi:hypothetical protein